MAKTAEQTIIIRDPGILHAFPVASGETIYKGTFAALTAGYLANLDSANLYSATLIALVADGSDNATGPAATTANGSISGTNEIGSVAAGDKTVRNVYLEGKVLVTGAGFAQTSVGKTCYLSDNYTGNISGTGAKLGTIVTYISSTQVYVKMNEFGTEEGLQIKKGALTAATTTTGGDALNWSPQAASIIQHMSIDVTTAATGAATVDIGVAATGTSNDTLMDGVDVGTAAIFASTEQNAGTNGVAPVKCSATQFVTVTPSATLAGLVGTYIIIYIKQ